MNRKQTTGSLDMLLDAMSNAFGSIVLICLLLLLNLSTKTDEILAENDEEMYSQARDSYIQVEHSLKLENDKIKDSIECLELMDLESNFEKEIELQGKLVKISEEHLKKLSAFKDSKALPKTTLSTQSEELKEHIQKLKALNSQLAELREVHSKQANKLISIRENAPRFNPILPINKSKSYTWVVLKEDYLIPLHSKLDQGYLREGIDDNLYVVFDPQTALTVHAFDSFLEGLDPKKEHLAFIVYQDSASVKSLRDLMSLSKQKGFSASWIPNLGGYLTRFSKQTLRPDLL